MPRLSTRDLLLFGTIAGGVFLTLCFVAGIVLLLTLVPTRRRTPAAPWQPAVGAACHLDNRGEVPLPTDWLAVSKAVKAIKAHDEHGLDELLDRNHVIFVEPGAPVLVLELSEAQAQGGQWVPYAEVRILAGHYKGRRACAFLNQLRP